jgi:nucleotide-binding universal stress UspA family protein
MSSVTPCQSQQYKSQHYFSPSAHTSLAQARASLWCEKSLLEYFTAGRRPKRCCYQDHCVAKDAVAGTRLPTPAIGSNASNDLKGCHMYKTILVHIDGSTQPQGHLTAAAQLANEHGAHLVGSAATGSSWLHYAALTGSMGAPMPEPDSAFEGLRNAAALRLEQFKQQAERLGVESFEARLIEDDTRYALLLQSRYADLVVLSQDGAGTAADPEAGLPAHVRHLPEHVALHGARPVLVVPPDYLADEPLTGTALVGWDGSMQAIRAIAGALPLLQRAGSVKLALINPDAQSELHGEEPGADMALYLARQGVRVEVVVEWTDATAGETLRSLARDCGAGLVVTGAYGHSRYREWILGGVTRALLQRAEVPLLIAH